MSARGLNAAQREIVIGMVMREENGNYVRAQIEKMSYSNNSDGWDYEKNVLFCRELSALGYDETAKNLEKLINNK